MIAAYVIVLLPRALVSLRAGIAQAPESLEEAARSLGSSPIVARVRVTVPLLVPAIAAGGALVALGAANELTATLLLAPTGTRTLATAVLVGRIVDRLPGGRAVRAAAHPAVDPRGGADVHPDQRTCAMNLTVFGVSKAFGATQVLEDISLDVAQGSRTAIVGASGSGKSTLLRLIAGFAEPDDGRITLGDRTLAAPGTSVAAHRRGIGYVAQDGALFPHLTVAGNIAFGLPRAGRAARVREVMELTALDPALADRYPHQISGGQQQRVALARALAPRPGIILLDEPFSALDTGLREHTRRAVIDALELTGTTAVLVTHDQDEALSFGHGIGVMVDGRLAQAGSPSSVFDDPETPEIASFLGPAVLLPARPGDGVAECALGTIPVRHDRSNGSRRAVAMVRPAQIDLVADGPGLNAVVHDVRPMGSLAEVSLLAGAADAAHPTVITLRVPQHQLGDLRPGSRVAIRVDGGAVLYPSDATGVVDEVTDGEPQPVGA